MLENVQTWFAALNANEQVFWVVALVASAIFIVQAILTLIGMDSDVDMDFDFTDGDTMDTGGAVSLFSIRSLVNFFVGFGWAGVTFVNMIPQAWVVYVISIIVGLCFAYLYILLRKNLMKLERNGAMKTSDCLGCDATVYLRIPGNGLGKGKVQISLNGSVHELDAITHGEELRSGSQVTVTEVKGNVLVVEKK